MTFPKQTLTVLDPGLGRAQNAGGTPLLSGIAHGGSKAVNTLQSISDPSKVRSEVGYGPLAEDVALALALFGGPVLYVIHNSAQDVNLAAVALTKLVGSGPSVTISGSPNDRYSIRVEIIAGGAVGTSTFRYTLDAWDSDAAPYTYSQTRPTVATFAIPGTALTLAFPVGTYVAGDVYTIETTPQEPGTVDLATVATLLGTLPQLDFKMWSLVGSQPDETTGAAVAAAFQTHLTALTNTYRYARGFCDVGSSDTKANVYAQALLWTGTRVSPGYGFVLRTSLLPFEGFSTRKISMSSGIAVRSFRELPSSDISRPAAGADEGVLKIYFDGFADQTLDDVKISTMRTWPGYPGFYFANAKLHSGFGSDYTDLQYGRVMDIACRVTYIAQVPFQSAEFRTVDDPEGAIDPRDAKQVEGVVQDALDNALMRPLNARGNPGYVSEVVYTVDQTNNLVNTEQLITTVGVRPLGYAKLISTTLSLTLNP